MHPIKNIPWSAQLSQDPIPPNHSVALSKVMLTQYLISQQLMQMGQIIGLCNVETHGGKDSSRERGLMEIKIGIMFHKKKSKESDITTKRMVYFLSDTTSSLSNLEL